MKKREVLHCIRSFDINLICILETKLTVIEDVFVNQLWPGTNVKWVASEARGRAGGILICWDDSVLTVNSTIRKDKLIGLSVTEVSSGKSFSFVGLHAPNTAADKLIFWQEVYELRQHLPDPWVLLGDFNVVLDASERTGGSFDARDAEHLIELMEKCELIDLPLKGKKFTWFSNCSASRIDRCLVNPDWLAEFPRHALFAEIKGLSDHCPLILRANVVMWGVKPFRTWDYWWREKDFLDRVKEIWEQGKIEFPGPYTLMKRFSHLLKQLKQWHMNNANNLEARLRETLQEIDIMDKKRSETSDSLEDNLRYRTLQSSKWNLKRCIESSWKQQSRVSWIKLGDKNTKFFHACANWRLIRNSIRSLKSNSGYIHRPEEIKDEISGYFKKLYSKRDGGWLNLGAISFNQLDPMVVQNLEAPFSLEEIKEAVQSCGSSKAPGPDGINFLFIKNAWSVIGHDICALIENFHKTGLMPKGLNSTYITLIPKVKNVENVSQFRPISLVTSLYKIISKILALRLKKIIAPLVSPLQSGFMEGRHLVDSVLIATETLHRLKQSKTRGWLLKIDFQKAYDSVDWDFMMEVMRRMGFSEKWRRWVHQCVSTATAAALVNGSPTVEFQLERGLRQGDPLSPFLFNLVAESLSRLIEVAASTNLIKGVDMGVTRISHLQYADDVVLFCLDEDESLHNIKRILRSFEVLSGLKINFFKSSLVGVNIEAVEVAQAARALFCKFQSLPIKYLGLPIGANPKRKCMWDEVINRVKQKLSGWKGKHLSIGGRTVLIKAVLNNLPVFYMSLFRIPVAVRKELEKIQRNFFWRGINSGRGLCNVSWSKVCNDKSKGGIGIGSIQAMNIALLFKWKWRFLSSEKGCWKSIIMGSSNQIQNLDHFISSALNSSPVWKAIVSCTANEADWCSYLDSKISKKIGSGVSTLFWFDIWCGSSPLKLLHPRLFELSRYPEASVTNMGYWREGAWEWNFSWRRNLRSWEEEDLSNLLLMIAGTQLNTNQPDQYLWDGSADGYAVKSCRIMLESLWQSAEQQDMSNVWKWRVSSKKQLMIWIACKERLSSKSLLVHRGVISHEDIWCQICRIHVEDSNHILLHCETAWKVWSLLFKRWGVIWIQPRNVISLVQQWDFLNKNSKLRELWNILLFEISWAIWINRNKIIFEQDNYISKSPFDIFIEACRQAFWWARHNLKDFNVSASDMIAISCWGNLSNTDS